MKKARLTEIALIAVDYPPVGGGVSRYYAKLAEAYGPGMRVIALGTSHTRPTLASTNRIVGRSREAIASARAVSKMEGSPRTFYGHPHLALGSVVRGAPFGLFLHGGEWWRVPGGPAGVRAIAKRATMLITNSTATAEAWLPSCVSERVLLLPPGVDRYWRKRGAEAFHARASDARWPLSLLTVARLVPRKGILELVAIVQQLRREELNVTLTIVGSGPLEPVLRARVGGDPGIILLGQVSDGTLLEAYASADIFVLCPYGIPGPEGFEGYGIVYLEAAAFGLPIIASSSGGVKEALATAGSSVIAEKDWPALAATIRVLVKESDRRKAQGMANLEWARHNSWESRVEVFQAEVRKRWP